MLLDAAPELCGAACPLSKHRGGRCPLHRNFGRFAQHLREIAPKSPRVDQGGLYNLWYGAGWSNVQFTKS